MEFSSRLTSSLPNKSTRETSRNSDMVTRPCTNSDNEGKVLNTLPDSLHMLIISLISWRDAEGTQIKISS